MGILKGNRLKVTHKHLICVLFVLMQIITQRLYKNQVCSHKADFFLMEKENIKMGGARLEEYKYKRFAINVTKAREVS